MPEVRIQCTAKQRLYLQTILFDDTADTVIFGGARGSGKTFIDCLAMVLRRLMHPNTMGLMIRRTTSAADQTLKGEIEKITYEILKMPRGSVRYLVSDRQFRFPNGSTINLGYCRRETDYEQYMGAQYADIAWEELTQHPQKSVQLVSGSCRSPVSTCKAKQSGNCNPGGIGHGWVLEDIIQSRRRSIRFIPSLPQDNLALLENDPGYIPRVLDPLPEWQRRQWRDGDWTAVTGAYFTLPPTQIVSRPIPYWAHWIAGVDWGGSAPFAVPWMAVWEDADGRKHCHVVTEFYKRNLELDEQALAAKEIEGNLVDKGILNADHVRYYGDPMIVKKLEGESTETGRTVRNVWAKYAFYVMPAHTNARVPGWHVIKVMLRHGVLTIEPTCRALIKEMQAAIYEGTEAGGEPTGEDIADGCSDHMLDALRYAIVSDGMFGENFTTEQQNPWNVVVEQKQLVEV